MSADESPYLVSYGADPLHALAELLLDRHASPTLSLHRQVVLFPLASAVPRFRQVLLARMTARGLTALLPPAAMTLAVWARRHADPARRCMSDSARAWTLYHVLRAHPKFSRHYGMWPLIDSLWAVFDDLGHHPQTLPVTLESFQHRVIRGYGTNPNHLGPLEDEAELVFSLWQAWQQHLADNRLQDPVTSLADGLARGLATLPADARLYLAGLVDPSPLEREWIRAALTRGNLSLVLHGQTQNAAHRRDAQTARLLQALKPGYSDPSTDTVTAITQLLDRVYTHDGRPLPERARHQRQSQAESPVHGRLAICETADAEHEARAIDLQVRRWLLAGLRNIGIVTNDRKLARRVRALLERAHIVLQDAGGWALSTTSAAAVWVRWLECLERDFPHTALLDLLKSPFVRIAPRQTVWQFEQTLVREQNITGGIRRYRSALARCVKDLAERVGADCANDIKALLDALEHAAAPLYRIQRGGRQDVTILREALLESLIRLGVTSAYEQDEAGKQLLLLIDDLRTPPANAPLRLTWVEFRDWLHRELERRRFHPILRGTGVELMGFAESRLYRFDALLIAGALQEHLPGPPTRTPFFNDSVRRHLGLPTSMDRLAVQFYDFRRLLEAAPRIVITLHREHKGERLAPSPWVEQLRAFHRMAYGNALHDTELERLSHMPDVDVVNREAPRPNPSVTARVVPVPSNLPAALSATAHQRLIDCPYQFYCSEILGLAPEPEIRDEIDKSDYGSYVHRVLQAFHAGVSGLPGPWKGPLTAERLDAAAALLREIAEAAFAQDLHGSYLVRGWLYRWHESIPAYLAWQMAREPHWKPEAAEIRKSSKICDDDTCLTLTGRIDRLDRGERGHAIIDYKTGSVPSRETIVDGEQVQLMHYALLCEPSPTQALFLGLSRSSITDKVRFEGTELATTAGQVQARLLRLYRDLKHGEKLTAWGDADTCERCSMEGVCRREFWGAEKK